MQALLAPFSLHTLTLPNRVVMAPMTRNKSPHHIPDARVAAYYKKRAEGGVGLIITEGTVVPHPASNGYPNVPYFYGEKPLNGWRQVVQGVHEAGGKIFPQLWHVGSVRQMHRAHNQGVDNPEATCEFEKNAPGYAPSPIPHPYVENADIPHEMTQKDIDDVIEAFAKAALDAKNIGFDGIELHGAHGYLIDQFFWAVTNKRTDQYGGKTLAARTRFAVELIQAVRDRVGKTFPICFRYSQWKLGDYQAKMATTPEELSAFLLPLKEAGVDIFHASTRRFWEPEFPDSPLNLAGWTKKITGCPTITVGSIGLNEDFIRTLKEHCQPQNSHEKLQQLIDALANQEYDFAAVGRALIADPEWVKKIIDNRFDDIIPFSEKSLAELN